VPTSSWAQRQAGSPLSTADAMWSACRANQIQECARGRTKGLIARPSRASSTFQAHVHGKCNLQDHVPINDSGGGLGDTSPLSRGPKCPPAGRRPCPQALQRTADGTKPISPPAFLKERRGAEGGCPGAQELAKQRPCGSKGNPPSLSPAWSTARCRRRYLPATAANFLTDPLPFPEGSSACCTHRHYPHRLPLPRRGVRCQSVRAWTQACVQERPPFRDTPPPGRHRDWRPWMQACPHEHNTRHPATGHAPRPKGNA
jgi:hypothetical protein